MNLQWSCGDGEGRDHFWIAALAPVVVKNWRWDYALHWKSTKERTMMLTVTVLGWTTDRYLTIPRCYDAVRPFCRNFRPSVNPDGSRGWIFWAIACRECGVIQSSFLFLWIQGWIDSQVEESASSTQASRISRDSSWKIDFFQQSRIYIDCRRPQLNGGFVFHRDSHGESTCAASSYNCPHWFLKFAHPRTRQCGRFSDTLQQTCFHSNPRFVDFYFPAPSWAINASCVSWWFSANHSIERRMLNAIFLEPMYN